MHVVYLKARGLPYQDTVQIARANDDNLTRYLESYPNEAMDDLVNAIQAVLESNRFISPALAQNHSPPSSGSPALDALSLIDSA